MMVGLVGGGVSERVGGRLECTHGDSEGINICTFVWWRGLGRPPTVSFLVVMMKFDDFTDLGSGGFVW